jgi:outer membrane protein OmpA-like peptidoglycan-associated protein
MRLKIFIIAIAVLSVLSCSKKVITIAESPEPSPKNADNEVMMVFSPGAARQTSPAPIKKPEQCVIVYFKFDSDELLESEKWKIKNIDRPVELIGGCCPIGSDDYNYTLGLRRAMTIKRFFETGGITVKSYISIGERELIETNREKYFMNRRCEVKY